MRVILLILFYAVLSQNSLAFQIDLKYTIESIDIKEREFLNINCDFGEKQIDSLKKYSNPDKNFSITVPGDYIIYEQETGDSIFSLIIDNPKISFKKMSILNIIEFSQRNAKEQFLLDYFILQGDTILNKNIITGKSRLNNQNCYWIKYKYLTNEHEIKYSCVIYIRNLISNRNFIFNITGFDEEYFEQYLCQYKTIIKSVKWVNNE
ncbi:hypothetical protein SAMN02927921_04271 [Sinomicrobium oceani]|uniref:Uncharacterized protein n=1 Tax=Sinomicrobium oceani TaxID=1150368 RepID=A0A1K1S0H3_9FLAO|nr:hypothetical protein [Sinomicrobium oceani]SFW77817.1 hypothetical protein SAMN02927921_04271 [Sinomicrobium oceani]